MEKSQKEVASDTGWIQGLVSHFPSLSSASLWGPGLSSYLMEANGCQQLLALASLSLIPVGKTCLSPKVFFFLLFGIESHCLTESYSGPYETVASVSRVQHNMPFASAAVNPANDNEHAPC